MHIVLYEFESWSFNQRKCHRLRIFENIVLRKISNVFFENSKERDHLVDLGVFIYS
jgi:hypothetical protein